MRGGQVIEQGTYADLMAREDSEFAAQMRSVGGVKARDGASSGSASGSGGASLV